MSEQDYQTLWHYSEQFSRDKLQRSELITFAFLQEKKLGKRCSLGLQKSIMHFRSKELSFRSTFPVDEMGKSQKDAWNKPERSYLDKPTRRNDVHTLGDAVLNTKTTPLDYCITNNFMSALSESETDILNDISSGYTMKEIMQRQHLDKACFTILRQSLQYKAQNYL